MGVRGRHFRHALGDVRREAGAACAGCGDGAVSEVVYSGSSVTYYNKDYDDASGVVETDGSYYTDLCDEDGSDENLEVSLDTVIVPVKSVGKPFYVETVAIYISGDDEEQYILELEVGDKEGFTVSELLSEGSVYQYNDEGEKVEVDDAESIAQSIMEDMYAAGTDGEPWSIEIEWSNALARLTGYFTGVHDLADCSIVLTEDAPEYSTVEVDIDFEYTEAEPDGDEEE